MGGWPTFLPDGRHFLYVAQDTANKTMAPSRRACIRGRVTAPDD